MDNLIKRILITPISTPWEPLYIETRIQEIGLTITRNRLNYMEKIEKSHNSVMKMIQEDQNPKGWWRINTQIKQDILKTNDNNHDMTNTRNANIVGKKELIKRKMKEKMMDTIKEGSNKTKTKFYLENKQNPIPGRRARYMNECNRVEASTIFLAEFPMA